MSSVDGGVVSIASETAKEATDSFGREIENAVARYCLRQNELITSIISSAVKCSKQQVP
jgi:hypothetical protein